VFDLNIDRVDIVCRDAHIGRARRPGDNPVALDQISRLIQNAAPAGALGCGLAPSVDGSADAERRAEVAAVRIAKDEARNFVFASSPQPNFSGLRRRLAGVARAK